MLVHVGLCQTCSETTLLVFPRGGSNIFVQKQDGVIDTAQCVSNLKYGRYHDTNTSDISKIFHMYIFKASTKRFQLLSRLRIYTFGIRILQLVLYRIYPAKNPTTYGPIRVQGLSYKLSNASALPLKKNALSYS